MGRWLNRDSNAAWLRVPQEVKAQRDLAVKAVAGERFGDPLRSRGNVSVVAFRVTQDDFDEFFAPCVLEEEVKALLKKDEKSPISTAFDAQGDKVLSEFDSHVKVMLRLAVFQLHILNAMGIDLTPLDSASEDEKLEAASTDGNLACVGLLADMTGQQVKGYTSNVSSDSQA